MQDLIPTDAAELARLAESDAARAAVPLERWPRQLVELLDCASAALARAGVEAAEAERLARIAVSSMAQLHGGRSFNLPRGDQLDRALRDDEIWRGMGRISADDLARRHGLTLQRVYQIYAEQRELRRRRDQPSLF